MDANAPLPPALDVTVGREVTFSFQVMNAGKKKLEVAFPDGRTHDVVVLDTRRFDEYRETLGHYLAALDAAGVRVVQAQMRAVERSDGTVGS